VGAGQLWALVGLGLFHGLNPGMGWLVAVSRGLQERSRAALLRSIPAIAGGHAASVALFALAFTATGALVASRWFTVACGGAVVGAGLWLLLSRRHFRWRGMRLSEPQLAGWSFLMSSAHGAGLMLVPVLAGELPEGGGAGGAGGHVHGAAAHPAGAAAPPGAASDPPGAGGAGPLPTLADATLQGLAAAAVHTAAMFAAAAVAALLVYDFLGVHVLRSTWVNTDRIWAFALVASGAIVLATA